MSANSGKAIMKCPNCGANMIQYKNQYKCQYCDAIVAIRLPKKKKKKRISFSEVWEKFKEVSMFIVELLAILVPLGIIAGAFILALIKIWR